MNQDLKSILHDAAVKFVNENFTNPTKSDFLVVYNAMIQASILTLQRQ